ncbi:MAG: hypothetical protein ACJA0C_001485 [Candidatus Endobugula sp.]
MVCKKSVKVFDFIFVILYFGSDHIMINLLLTIIASIVLLFGLISMVTPIPGGTIMIAGSLTTLICVSPRAQSYIRAMRTRINWFNKAVFWLEEKVGTRISFMGEALEKTRPDITEDNMNDDDISKKQPL